MIDQIFRHEGMVSFIPKMQKKIRRHIKIQPQTTEYHQSNGLFIQPLSLKAPGIEITYGGQENGNDTTYDVVHDMTCQIISKCY